MFDSDDFLKNYLNNNSTTTTQERENEIEQNTSYNGSQTSYINDEDEDSYSSYQSPYIRDDYTTTQNYSEEQTYNPVEVNSFNDVQEQKVVKQMEVPLIKKDEQPVVKLIKTTEKIHLETRMKIVLNVFMVIVACLLFISIYNFSQADKIQASFADKQVEINNLKQSISTSKVTYTLVSDEEYLKQWAEDNNYVVKNEDNTKVIELNEMFTEETVEEIPSNWFNDVCEFFSKLFA